jgi:predicted HicB family RNase H-like nuclease
MVSKAQKKATKNYNDSHYDVIKIYVKKGEKDKIREKAQKENKSLNQYVTEKIYGDNE